MIFVFYKTQSLETIMNKGSQELVVFLLKQKYAKSNSYAALISKKKNSDKIIDQGSKFVQHPNHL